MKQKTTARFPSDCNKEIANLNRKGSLKETARCFLLDSSFILTCVKQKIDFFEELVGTQILIPEQVINEIKNLKNSNSELSLKLLEKNKFKKIDLGKGHVDKRIIKFAKENPKTIIATLDREIKNKTKNQKLIIKGKKKLEIV